MPQDPAGYPPRDGANTPEAYDVQERIAVGTAGVVYRAVQRATGQPVLFKVLVEQASHPLDTTKVLALAPALQRLEHPHIARLLEAYADPEGTVLVYPLSTGIAGNEYPHAEQPLTVAAVREAARQLCGALVAGEALKLPHGDLKPSNLILCDAEGALSVQVQDWGLSQCRVLQPPETLLYAAPERHFGQGPSPRADLFSLGAVLWQMLTGRPPVEAAGREALLQTWGLFRVDTLAGLRPDVDAHFRQWLGWLLRWQPPERPMSASEALEVLASGGLPTRLARVPTSVPAPVPAGAPRGRTTEKLVPPRPTEKLRTTPGPATAGRSPAPATAAPAGERRSAMQTLMAIVMTCCVLGVVGVGLVWWAEETWGPDWRTELTARVKQIWKKNPSDGSAPVTAVETPPLPPKSPDASPKQTSTTPRQAPTPAPKPGPPPGTTSAKMTAGLPGPPSPVAAAAAPPARPAVSKPPAPRPPAASSKPVAAVDLLQYGAGTSLEGASGGAGWKGPWKAVNAAIGSSPDGKHQGVLLGGAESASLVREVDAGNSLNNGSVSALLALWHPGNGAASLEVDLLGQGSEISAAPLLITTDSGRPKIAIKGGFSGLYLPSMGAFTLAVKWSFKKKPSGTADVDIQVWLNPAEGTSNPVSLAPSVKSTLRDWKPGSTLPLLFRTTGPGTAPVVLQRIILARTVKEAVEK